MRGSATSRSVLALAALLLGVTGCTICPDPFDYTGPVPDGSTPQNDFRSRANGIATPGSHPVPWPPVVQATRRPGDESREISAGASAVDETAADLRVDAALADAVTIEVEPAAAEEADQAAGIVAPETPVAEEPTVEDILPPPAAARPETLPRLRETPGWRPRG